MHEDIIRRVEFDGGVRLLRADAYFMCDSIRYGSPINGSILDEYVAVGSVVQRSMEDGTIVVGSVMDWSVIDGSIVDGSIEDRAIVDGLVVHRYALERDTARCEHIRFV